ncbi:DUF4260 domain-containing protein [Paenibacillus hamazuiensis]|uniref:DUF4260 domain-containing protein n=1 Tax=Paenibacillus hamazuiensis TaxID=2936508 RepID=UPI00200ED6A5|nr:DUF4260 domain-containing protein [Paenibacillus hamazuiensis]
MNKILIKLENLVVFIICIFVFYRFDFSWVLFIILIFAPDISMVGYLKGNVVGARTYNLFHTYLLSTPVLLLGLVVHMDLLTEIGLIWTAHIGIDRFLGYGVKYDSGFKDTHINRL